METTPILNASFWDQQYQLSHTFWDMGFVSPPLKAYIDQVQNKDLRILIPGCGNAYEADYLLQNGFKDITLIDVSKILCDGLKEKYKDQTAVKILEADFFELEGQYDLILEQTFFCALNPALRKNYPIKMSQLLAPKGQLVGLLFIIQFHQSTPPFGGSKEEYAHLFFPYFESHTFQTCYNSHPKRQGSELFINLVKRNAPISSTEMEDSD